MQKHNRFAWTAFFSILGLLILSACEQGKTQTVAAPANPLAVSIIEPQPQNLPTSIELVAQTEGAKETEVRARAGGILLKQLFKDGAPVQAGQPLFQIDPAPYELLLMQSKARAEQTAREVARLKGLVAHQAISQKEYTDAVSADAIAQAELRQATLNLSWTTVKAPVSGISGRALKPEGSLISTSDATALTSVYQLNPIWVRFGLTESDIVSLPGGQLQASMVNQVELIFQNGQTHEQTGKLNFLSATIDPTLGTQQLRAEFNNQDGRLMPGQFVRIRLHVGERKNVFLVPQAAVMQNEQSRSVMVVASENKVVSRPVETAEWQGSNWVITKGLSAGDKVIVDNLMKLRAGMTVTPTLIKTIAQ